MSPAGVVLQWVRAADNVGERPLGLRLGGVEHADDSRSPLQASGDGNERRSAAPGHELLSKLTDHGIDEGRLVLHEQRPRRGPGHSQVIVVRSRTKVGAADSWPVGFVEHPIRKKLEVLAALPKAVLLEHDLRVAAIETADDSKASGIIVQTFDLLEHGLSIMRSQPHRVADLRCRHRDQCALSIGQRDVCGGPGRCSRCRLSRECWISV